MKSNLRLARSAPADDPQRLALRELWQFILTADPDAVAREARYVKRTLLALGELERWLARYRAALERRAR